MNTISIYVTVGAISFVKCQLSYNFIESPLGKHTPQYTNGDQKTVIEEDKFGITGESYGLGDKGTNILEKENAEEEQNEKNDFFQSLRHFKHIYDQCKNRFNKRLKKVGKTKVNISIGRQLNDFKDFVLSMYKCVKVYSFLTLDEALDEKWIPLTDYAYFIKDESNDLGKIEGREMNFQRNPKKLFIPHYANTIINTSWTTLAYERLNHLLRSYSLKINVDKSVEARGRRRDHRMFAMMVMGFMIMASILIPMGFQFLTVLGGKSLLMAKMALIMSAINGLKKIATSNVGYGFYHTGSDGHHHDHVHHGFHEKLYQPNPNQYGYNP